MKNLRQTAILLLICLLLVPFCPVAGATDYSEYTLPVPNIDAISAIVIEFDGDRMLYGKNENTATEPANLTKVMTILLTVEAIERGEISLDDVVTVGSDYKQGVPDNTNSVVLRVGEKLTLRDLMHCAMLASSNESCNVIASYVSGSIDAFVALMNTRAKMLGCENTRFVNTNGLSRPGHFTTASDFAVIVKEALSHELFAEICGTAQYTVPATNMNGERTLANTNALICAQSYYGSKYLYPGAYGVKTGYTTTAGYCLAAAAEKNGINVLVLVFDSSKTINGYGHFVDVTNLLDWAFNNFSIRSVVEKGTKLGEVEVINGDSADTVSYVTAESVRSFLPNGFDESGYQTIIKLDNESVKAPVLKGDRLGAVTVLDQNGEEYGTVELVAAEDVGSQVWETLKGEISDFFSQWWMTALTVIIILGIVFFCALNLRSRSRRRKSEAQRRRRAEERENEQKRQKEKAAHREYYKNFLKDEDGEDR